MADISPLPLSTTHHCTPLVTVLDNRNLTVREIQFHRHPGTPDITNEHITHHIFNAHGFLMQSADPRLHKTGQASFTYLTNLIGTPLKYPGERQWDCRGSQ